MSNLVTLSYIFCNLTRNPFFVLYMITFIYVSFLLFNLLYNLYLFMPDITHISLNSLEDLSLSSLGNLLFYYVNSSLMSIDAIDVETLSAVDSNMYFTTPSDGNTGGTNTTGNASGIGGASGGDATSNIMGTGDVSGSSVQTRNIPIHNRGPRTDVSGVDCSNNPNMDKIVSTDPCVGNSNRPHLWLKMNI